jgi:16S rRNA (cytidine1402-2'-O)-methyltransferase
MSGTLYVVATPIGNLGDVTARAASTLERVDRIACEDTRHTAKLLQHLAIHRPTVSYHEHNEEERAGELIETLESGADIALVTDAGTPLVSDPGYRLVQKAVESGIRVVPIPGPSAMLAALAASGLATDEFRFCGFLPAKAGARGKKLSSLKQETCTLVFFEAPHRLLVTLEAMEQELGDRPAVIAREITKLHEEFLRGRLSELRATMSTRRAIKGEITLVVGKASSTGEASSAVDLAAELEKLELSGMARMQAIKEIARKYKMPKREVYRIAAGTPANQRLRTNS